MKKETPIFGMVPYFGGQWSIQYQPHDQYTQISHSGYGQFPHDRFNVPVIDLTGDDRGLDLWLKNDFRDGHTYNPSRALQFAIDNGLNVINQR